MKRTEHFYLKRYESLKKQFENEVQLAFCNDQLGVFLEWLSVRAGDWSPATRRLYKASLNYGFSIHEIPVSDNKLSGCFKSNLSKKNVQFNLGRRTSSLKAKKLDGIKWHEVKRCLQDSSSPKAVMIIKLIEASRVFGLRPIEWAYSEFETEQGNRFGIKVKNAKASQGRSFGLYRTICLENEQSNLSVDVLDAVHFAYDLVNYFAAIKKELSSVGQEFEEIYFQRVNKELRACRVLLGQINCRLEKRKVIQEGNRITLYSGRNQFAADTKKSGLTNYEIAALMGHRALDTNEKYYGRKINGKRGVSVYASGADMQSIKQRKEVGLSK